MSYVKYNFKTGMELDYIINDDGYLLGRWCFLHYPYVAVYLDFITETGEGTSYAFDFVTSYGLDAYMDYLGDNPITRDISISDRIGTYIQLINVKEPLHVEEKQYYLLKVDSLDLARMTSEVTSLYMSVYNYADIEGKDTIIPELIPLPGLNGIVYNGPAFAKPQIPSWPRGVIKLKVNKVGRGNWNEIVVDDKTEVVYDIGTYIEKKSRNQFVDGLIGNHQYGNNEPTLIISHWDLDHYNVFLFMSNKEREQFSQMIVTSTLPSLTPFRLLQEVVKNTKIKLSLVDNNSRKLTAPVNYIDVNNPALKLFVCPMKMNGSRFNTNESGLLLDIDADDKNILLTGDCTYAQASDALKQSYAQVRQDKDHYLVVPHHGGGHQPKYQLPAYCKLKTAILSVDELKKDNKSIVVRHRYGHPTKEVVYHFIKEHNCKLLRTDYCNEDILIG